MEATLFDTIESRLAAELDKYNRFRVVLRIKGFRFNSEPMGRSHIDRMLANEPTGMIGIEGLPLNPFTPED